MKQQVQLEAYRNSYLHCSSLDTHTHTHTHTHTSVYLAAYAQLRHTNRPRLFQKIHYWLINNIMST